MSDLARWKRLAIDRAAMLALTSVELEEARTKSDPEKLIIADRYHHQAKRLFATAERLFATAERKVAELSQVA